MRVTDSAYLILANNPNITSPVVGVRDRVRVAEFAAGVLNVAECYCDTIVIQSPYFIPVVSGIVVDVVHAVDAIEVIIARVGVPDDIPFLPRATANGTNGGAGVGSKEVSNHARVSNIEVGVLMKR